MDKLKHTFGDIVYIDFTATIIGMVINQATGKMDYTVRIGNQIMSSISEDYIRPTPKEVE